MSGYRVKHFHVIFGRKTQAFFNLGTHVLPRIWSADPQAENTDLKGYGGFK